jgi:O-antigen/teichoic acid export membrane protein
MSLERGIKLIAAILLVFLGYELLGALFAIFFSSLIAASFGFWLLRRCVFRGRSDPDKEVMKKILFFSIPTAMITIFFTVLLRSDVILLKFLLPLDTANIEVGYYTGSALLARLIFYFSGAVPVVLLPVVSSVHEERGFELRDAKKIIPLIIIVFAIINLLYFSFGYDLVKMFFPPAYLKSAYVLPYLALGISILSIDNIIATMLIGMGKPKAVVEALGVGLAVYLGLVFLLSTLNFSERSTH